MPKLCAKDFNVYVDVQAPTEAVDGFGGYTTTWAAKTNLWCKYEERSGDNALENGKITTFTGVIFTTFYRADIYTTDRILLDGLYYNISRVDNLDRANIYLKIYCESGVVT